MTENETFLTRWSRLKRESGVSESGSDEPGAHREQSVDTNAREQTIPAPPCDLTALPPIESISAQSDVIAFLQAGVPEEWTRAALRKAWTADPAIREFIGIADNQWDFNGENTIAGFGPIQPEDYVRHFAEFGGNLDEAAAPTPAAIAPESCASTMAEPQCAGRVADIDPPADPPPAIAPAGEAPVIRKSHGSALPKW